MSKQEKAILTVLVIVGIAVIICGEDIYIWNNGEIIKLEKE